MLKRTFKALKDMIFPDSCCLCGDVFSYFEDAHPKILFGEKKVTSPYCADCTKALMKSYCDTKENNFEGIGIEYLFVYDSETVQKALKHIKRTRCEKCARFFASLLNQAVKDEKIRNITYIPRSVKLERKYGFDQSERIMSTFVRMYEEYRKTDAFKRNKNFSVPQKKLSAKDRFINAEKSLVLQENIKLPKEIIIFDDIITSGATAKTASNLLYNGGVKNIKLIFLAKAGEITEERRKINE
ncbi:MAG: ComF family protein [Ruminococcaceae bacterium]|nr:ComF family protein [Oscillospiraceae bacterium]